MQPEIVLVTGASGFLGHHVVRQLISRDERVQEIRCLDAVEPESSKRELIEGELEKFNKASKEATCKHVKWIKGDIRDINIVEQSLDGADCVIHCAAKVDIWTESESQDADELESINVCGTENLLKASIRLGVSKFIHVSSFEVYSGYGTVYYATEATLPEYDWLLFGASARTKKFAELKVKQYSRNKLAKASKSGHDSLNAVIVRFPLIYGEHDKTYISKILEMAKYFGGKLRRIDNVWIVQQPIYVGNAAWSLIKARHRMDQDQSISGEEFHVTDDTTIGDPFDFLEPFVEAKGMTVTKTSYPYLPILAFLLLFSFLRRLVSRLDFFGLISSKRNRLQEAIEKDKSKALGEHEAVCGKVDRKRRWYHYWHPASITLLAVSSFLNRTKSSLRLDYDPIYNPQESHLRSLKWYRDELKLENVE